MILRCPLAVCRNIVLNEDTTVSCKRQDENEGTIAKYYSVKSVRELLFQGRTVVKHQCAIKEQNVLISVQCQEPV